jgi:phenylacetate-CoA oxygenase PaaH subunit
MTRAPSGTDPGSDAGTPPSDDPLAIDGHTFEVFGRRRVEDPLEHVGTLHAPDETAALLLARETHFRHQEGVDYAVVRSDHLHRCPTRRCSNGGSTSPTASRRATRASARSASRPGRQPTRAGAVTCGTGRCPVGTTPATGQR